MMSPPPGLRLERNVPLATMTTVGVGGPARYFLAADDPADAIAAIDWARQSGLDFWILGGGSNALIADNGLDGLVIHPNGQRLAPTDLTQGHLRITVDAGHDWDRLVRWSVDRNLAGIECLSGIPGRVGAAPIQNIGAYGQQVSDVLDSVEVLDLETLQANTWGKEECRFGYRDSHFKRAGSGRYLVLSLSLVLQTGGAPTLAYADIRNRLGLDGASVAPGAVSLQHVRETVLSIRRGKGMVVDPEDADSRSAGSFFVNPVVAIDTADRIEGDLGAERPMPRYPTDQGSDRTKLSAAWLIERCGMSKGYGLGPVGLSSKHTLAIVNRGGASAAQILDFAAHVHDRVEQGCGVRLVREPVLLGFAGAP